MLQFQHDQLHQKRGSYHQLHLPIVVDNYLMKQEEENNNEEHTAYEIAYNIGLKDGQIKSYKKLMDTMTNFVTDVIYALMPEGKA